MRYFALALLLISLVGSIPCGAAAEEGPYRLDDIVVTASRIGTPLRETPANITIITSEEMERKGAVTLNDVFNEEPSLFTKSFTGTVKQSAVDIRGYGEAAPQNVLFLMDGRRINNPDTTGADLALIPVAMIERVEIYRGPASVMFGDNAAAGAINIILKKGEGPPTATAKILGGSYNTLAPSLTVSGSDKKFSYFLLASSFDTDGYRENQGVQMKDTFANISLDPLSNLSFNIKTGFHKDRYGLPGAILWQNLIGGAAKRTDATTPFDQASTEDSFVDLDATTKIVDDVTLSLAGSYRNRHNAYNSHFSGPGYTGDTEAKGNVETYGFTPKLVIDKPIFLLKNTFTVGFDYYKSPYSLDSSGTTTFFGFPFPSHTTADIHKTDYGVYANERIHLLKDLLLDIGYRVHKAIFDTTFTDHLTPALSSSFKTHSQKEVFRSSINYAFAKEGNIFLTYAKGFRFPTADEFVNIQTGQITNGLKPQDGWEVDMGVRWNPFARVGGTLTLFQGKNRDEIFYNPFTFANANFDKTKRQGIETQLLFVILESLKLRLGYSYTDAKLDGSQFVGGVDVNGNTIPLVPKNKFSANVSYTIDRFTFNLIGVYNGARYTISDQLNSHRQLPGYTTFDTNVAYRYKRFEALFGIKNLTGKEYSEFGVASATTARINLYPSPERQYFARLAYTF